MAQHRWGLTLLFVLVIGSTAVWSESPSVLSELYELSELQGDAARTFLDRDVSFTHALDDHGAHVVHQTAYATERCYCLMCQANRSGQSAAGKQDSAGGGVSAADATNPTAAIKVFQIQNTFIPKTYDASGYGNVLSLQAVIPFKTRSEFFPSWVTRTTLPIISSADPDGEIPIGPGNDTDFSIPLDNQAGLGDLVFISIFSHPTDWGSWGIGPGFVAPTATRAASRPTAASNSPFSSLPLVPRVFEASPAGKSSNSAESPLSRRRPSNGLAWIGATLESVTRIKGLPGASRTRSSTSASSAPWPTRTRQCRFADGGKEKSRTCTAHPCPYSHDSARNPRTKGGRRRLPALPAPFKWRVVRKEALNCRFSRDP